MSNKTPNSNTRFALLLIIVGFLTALDVISGYRIISKLWPLLVTMLGAGLTGIFIKRGGREALYLIPGVYLVCFSLFALYLNFTSWSSMSFLWPLFILFMGISFMAAFIFCKKHKKYILLSLLLISVSFVFLITGALGGEYWWSVFILIGISILISEKAGNEE
ncbi:MAG: hypothetical protein ACLFQK_00745 [Fibrobacterota bacterium]